MLHLKTKKLVKILELETELFGLLSISNGAVDRKNYKKLKLEYQEKIEKEKKRFSLWK